LKLVRAKCSEVGEREGGRRTKAEILLEIFHTAENSPPATYPGVASYKNRRFIQITVSLIVTPHGFIGGYHCL
jgi:hypothetical protein